MSVRGVCVGTLAWAALVCVLLACPAAANDGKCSGKPTSTCKEAGANQSMCTDGAHTGCVWDPEAGSCSGKPDSCDVLTNKGITACEQMPGCKWSESPDVWVGIAVFVAAIVGLVLILFITKLIYQRYIMSRPAEPGMDNKSNSFQKFFSFQRKGTGNRKRVDDEYDREDGYVPPAKNDLSEIAAAGPVVKELQSVKIVDSSDHLDPVEAYESGTESAAAHADAPAQPDTELVPAASTESGLSAAPETAAPEDAVPAESAVLH